MNDISCGIKPGSVLLIALVQSVLVPEVFSDQLDDIERAIDWSTGTKSALIVRLDSAEYPGDPLGTFSRERALEEFSAAGNEVLRISNGKTSMEATATDLLRLPGSIAAYDRNTLLRDALQLVEDSGLQGGSFDRIALCYDSGPLGGQFRCSAELEGETMWMPNCFQNRSAIVHELFHTYGLYHANSWIPLSRSRPYGPGRSSEYGDLFDIMGSGKLGTNPFYKYLLGWIDRTAIRDISASGSYELFPAELGGDQAASKVQALRVRRDGQREYWVVYRDTFQSPDGTITGVSGISVLQVDLETRQTNVLRVAQRGFGHHPYEDQILKLGEAFDDDLLGIRFQFDRATGGVATVDVSMPESRPIGILEHPTTQSIEFGKHVEIEARIRGGLPIELQWHHNGSPIPGATHASLVFTSFSKVEVGEYFLVASNDLGSVNTNTVRLMGFDRASGSFCVGDQFDGGKLDSDYWNVSADQNVTIDGDGDTIIVTAREGDQATFDFEKNALPAYTSWDAVLDLDNSLDPFGEIQLRIECADDPDQAFLVSMTRGVPALRAVYSIAFDSATRSWGHESASVGRSSGSIRIAYDHEEEVLTSYFDVDTDPNAYEWIKLRSIGIGGSGGDLNRDWGITPADYFRATILVKSANATTSGAARLDAFKATLQSQGNELGVSPTQEGVKLTWPVAPRDWHIEESTSLSDWRRLEVNPIQVGSDWCLEIEPDLFTPRDFFRLVWDPVFTE